MGYFFILNPKAGTAGLWPRFVKAGLPKDAAVFRTQGRGHATELAQEALKKGYDKVVAVGGDGTLSEVAHGLLSGGGIPKGFILAHLPAGSGCDVARHFKLPRLPERWPEFLEGGVVSPIDAASATWTGGQRYFINIAMAGIAGDIAHTMERTGKPLGGVLSYLGLSLAHILSDKARPVTITADGKRISDGSYHLIALSNTSTTGGGMKIAPDADAQDGWLELVAVRAMSTPKLLWSFPKIYAGKHLGVPGVDCGRAKVVTLESPVPVRLNIDGEPLGTLPVKFELMPRALPFLMPRS
jgi:diacylglycerol kinase (ATP)